jgi:hypothetical protein
MGMGGERSKKSGNYDVEAGDEAGETTGRRCASFVKVLVLVFFSLFCFTCLHDRYVVCACVFSVSNPRLLPRACAPGGGHRGHSIGGIWIGTRLMQTGPCLYTSLFPLDFESPLLVAGAAGLEHLKKYLLPS